MSNSLEQKIILKNKISKYMLQLKLSIIVILITIITIFIFKSNDNRYLYTMIVLIFSIFVSTLMYFFIRYKAK